MVPAWRMAGMLKFFAPDPFSQEISMPKASSKAASPRRATRTKSSSTELAQPTTPALQQAGPLLPDFGIIGPLGH